MKQRLGIAAALIGDPELLILDEPANGLDPQGVRDIRALVGSLAGTGRTVLVSSHDLSELEQICDWLVLIDGGRSLYQGPTRAPARRSGTRASPWRRSARPMATRCGTCSSATVSSSSPVTPSSCRSMATTPGRSRASINRVAFDAGIVLAELSHRRTTLEDRYLAMAEGGSR